MGQSAEQQIFRKGSTTYYFSSLFFPEPIKTDVFKFYSFVRVADNYVDEQPAQPQKLRLLEQLWQDPNAKNTLASDIDLRVVANVREVITKYDCDPAWVDAFFAAMKSDISP